MLARLSFPIHDVSGDDTSSMVWAFYGQVAVLGSRNTEKDLHWPTCRYLFGREPDFG